MQNVKYFISLLSLLRSNIINAWKSSHSNDETTLLHVLLIPNNYLRYLFSFFNPWIELYPHLDSILSIALFSCFPFPFSFIYILIVYLLRVYYYCIHTSNNSLKIGKYFYESYIWRKFVKVNYQLVLNILIKNTSVHIVCQWFN